MITSLPDLTEFIQATRCQANDQFAKQYLSGQHTKFPGAVHVVIQSMSQVGFDIFTSTAVGLKKQDLQSLDDGKLNGRSSITLVGKYARARQSHVPGFNAAKSRVGATLMERIQLYFWRIMYTSGCLMTQEGHVFSLIWRGDAKPVNGRKPTYILRHCDQKQTDTNNDGTPNVHTVRAVHSVGKAFEILFFLYLITFDTDNVDGNKDGEEEEEERDWFEVDSGLQQGHREKKLAEASFLVPAGAMSYIFSPEASGRHCIGRIKEGGVWKALVFMHATRPSTGEQVGDRMIVNSDFPFGSREQALQFIQAYKNGGIVPESSFSFPLEYEGSIPSKRNDLTASWLSDALDHVMLPFGTLRCSSASCRNYPSCYDPRGHTSTFDETNLLCSPCSDRKDPSGKSIVRNICQQCFIQSTLPGFNTCPMCVPRYCRGYRLPDDSVSYSCKGSHGSGKGVLLCKENHGIGLLGLLICNACYNSKQNLQQQKRNDAIAADNGGELNNEWLDKDDHILLAESVEKYTKHGCIQWVQISQTVFKGRGFTGKKLRTAWETSPVKKKKTIPNTDEVVKDVDGLRRYFRAGGLVGREAMKQGRFGSKQKLENHHMIRIAKAIYQEGYVKHGKINWNQISKEIKEFEGIPPSKLADAWLRGPAGKKRKIPGAETAVDSVETLEDYLAKTDSRGRARGSPLKAKLFSVMLEFLNQGIEEPTQKLVLEAMGGANAATVSAMVSRIVKKEGILAYGQARGMLRLTKKGKDFAAGITLS